PDKPQHQLFLEPEGETTQELYLNGFSSSLPMNIQIAALKQIPAFRDLVIYRPGYAIEYDFFDPTQLKHTLETKNIKNLFFAGQVTEQPVTRKQLDKESWQVSTPTSI